jgi:hypothetical protein
VGGWSKKISTESEAHNRPKYPTPGDLFNGWKPGDGMSEGRDHGHNLSGQTEDGPPSKSGVLNVVDTLEQTPWHTTLGKRPGFLLEVEGNTIILNAKLI